MIAKLSGDMALAEYKHRFLCTFVLAANLDDTYSIRMKTARVWPLYTLGELCQFSGSGSVI